MRVLWLSPWMRTLGRVQTEALQRLGAEVILVTTDQHPESDGARDYEVVLDARFKAASTWPATLAAGRRLRRFRPDVVITELVRDPRWMAFAGRAPRIQMIHDDRAHDPAERPPGYERAVFDRWGAGSAATVTFSDYVRCAVGNRRDVAGTELHTIALTSELDPALCPPPAGPADRRDFVLVGRLNPYKNIDVALAAWQAHVAGKGWRGDDLVLIGHGDDRPLPPHTRWIRGSYRYRDVLGTLASAKGSLVHYRRATQSGVQVLSMQLGVAPIVSAEGGLPEFQPPGWAPVGVDDTAGLTAAFDRLADPVTAARDGAVAARHYDRHFTAEHAATGLLGALSAVTTARLPGSATARRAVRTTG